MSIVYIGASVCVGMQMRLTQSKNLVCSNVYQEFFLQVMSARLLATTVTLATSFIRALYNIRYDDGLTAYLAQRNWLHFFCESYAYRMFGVVLGSSRL